MLARLLPVLAVSCTAVSAHAHHYRPHLAARQTSSGSASASHSGTVPPAATPPPSTTANPPPTGATPVPGVTASDAVPLAQIVPIAVQPSDTTSVIIPYPTAGAKPSGLPNAPGLPDLSTWSSQQANYPSPDPTVPLDTNHPKVQEWIKQVQNSGITIPDIKPYSYTGDGDNCALPENVARKAEWEKDGWWTCGHYTRDTDITECKNPKTWGSSFDDGPSDPSTKLLDWLGKQNLKTTFFDVGTSIYWRPQNLQAEYAAGHQIAVHTWNHHALTNLTTNEIIAELGWTKQIIKDVIGVTPQYMRPPYGDIDDRVRAIAAAMDLTPVMWTVTGTLDKPEPFDTFDWNVPGGTATAVDSYNQFQALLALADQFGKGFIVLEHDLYWQQVDLAIGYFIPGALAKGYKVVPVYECAGQDLNNAYFETRTVQSLPGGSVSGGGNGTTGGQNGTKPGGGNSGGDAALPLREAANVITAMLIAGSLAVAAAL